VFVAQFASIVLTFLAGAEVVPDDFRERLGASPAIGLVSFAGRSWWPGRWPTGCSAGR
jgi:Kef-type K+ transport system membrane component KefB